jgi:hypothetical protein
MPPPNDDALVHHLLTTTPRLRRLSRRIRRQQELLLGHLTPAGWRVYLELEELVNARMTDLIDLLVKHLRKQPRKT